MENIEHDYRIGDHVRLMLWTHLLDDSSIKSIKDKDVIMTVTGFSGDNVNVVFLEDDMKLSMALPEIYLEHATNVW